MSKRIDDGQRDGSPTGSWQEEDGLRMTLDWEAFEETRVMDSWKLRAERNGGTNGRS